MSQDAFQALRFPCGQGGINRTKNLYAFPPTDLMLSDGITTESDTWKKEGGATPINTTVGAVSLRGLVDFWTGANPPLQELVAILSDGRLVTLDASGIVKTLRSGLGDAVPMFQHGWDGSTKALYVANGQGQIQAYTGGLTASDIPHPNPDWTVANGFPTGLAQHRARLGAFGMATRPHDLFLSLPSEHGNFNDPESFRQEVDPGVGDGIVSAISWNKKFYVAKRPLGIYVLEDADANLANWSIPQLTPAIGLAGPGGWVQMDSDVIVLAADGFFYSLQQVQSQGTEGATPLLPMETGTFLREQLNLDRLDLVQMLWYAHKRQVWVSAPGVGSQVNNRRIVLDFHTSTPTIQFSRRDVAVSLALRRASRTSVSKPIMGDASGIAWSLDQSTPSKNGVGYTGQFETGPQAFFPDAIRMGNLEAVEVLFQEQGDYDLNVEVHRDGKLSQTLTFSQQSVGAAVGSVSFDAEVLAGTTIANRRRKAGGDALRCKLIGYNTIVGQTFSIQELNVQFTPGGDRRPQA